jgi:hypothetical protein
MADFLLADATILWSAIAYFVLKFRVATSAACTGPVRIIARSPTNVAGLFVITHHPISERELTFEESFACTFALTALSHSTLILFSLG